MRSDWSPQWESITQLNSYTHNIRLDVDIVTINDVAYGSERWCLIHHAGLQGLAEKHRDGFGRLECVWAFQVWGFNWVDEDRLVCASDVLHYANVGI